MQSLLHCFFSSLPFWCSIILTFRLFVVAQPPYDSYQLVWSDEFDVDGLPNSNNWGYEEGCSVRNNELQFYTKARRENARIENGALIIEARREKMGNCNYTSANLVSSGKKTFKYGLFEIRAKIDIRSGSWPAWWWLPNSGGWPRGGEIDMMEFYQGKLLFNVMDGNQKWTSKTQAVASIGGSEWADQYHVWTWEWDSLKIDLWLDGKLMNHYLVANANGTGPNGENPFHRPGYMLLNQAIGGNNGGDPSGTTFPVQYIVDYVRYYQPGKDTVAPKVVAVTAATNGNIVVLFSESVEKGSAEKLSNYTIGSTGITLSAAVLQSDGRTVIITASGLEINGRHELTIQGITDCVTPPNPLAVVKKEFTVEPESRKLTGAVIGNGAPYNGANDVVYDKAVDGSTSTFADCTGQSLWVGYDFGTDASYVITGFRYYPRNGYADRMSGKTFEISHDGTTWENVYTIPAAPPEGQFTTVAITPSKSIRYVRYNGSGGNLNAVEVEFLGFPSGALPLLLPPGGKNTRPGNGLLLQPPFTVTLYSLDGKCVASWTNNTHEDPVSFSHLLTTATGIPTTSRQLFIVTIRDATRCQLRYVKCFPE